MDAAKVLNLIAIFGNLVLIVFGSYAIVMAMIAIYRATNILRYKSDSLEINNHYKTVDYVEKLMGLIGMQINKSTAIVLLTKQAVHKRDGIKTISLADATEIITDITNHVYSNIPKIITTKLLFRYITQDQIALLIYNEFINQNAGYYVIRNEEPSEDYVNR